MKFNKGTIAATLTLTMLVAGAVGTTAFAANADNSALQSAAVTQQTQTNDVQTTETENSTDAAALAAQAKITEADAIAAAEAANSGYSFTVDELGSENGALVYELKGTDSNGNKLKVLVDATDGSIVTQASDAENGGDTNDENGDNENSQNQVDLAAQAKITEADAIAAAEAANNGYTFTVNKLDSENSVVTYELKGIDGNGSEIEVQVNAIDGSIIQEAESD